MDCTNAEVVLVSGMYLTFHLAISAREECALVEVKRWDMSGRARPSLLHDAAHLQRVRSEVTILILAHRAKMRNVRAGSAYAR